MCVYKLHKRHKQNKIRVGSIRGKILQSVMVYSLLKAAGVNLEAMKYLHHKLEDLTRLLNEKCTPRPSLELQFSLLKKNQYPHSINHWDNVEPLRIQLQ